MAEVASAGKLLPIAAARHEVHIFYYSFVENGEDMRTAATVFGCYLLVYVFAKRRLAPSKTAISN